MGNQITYMKTVRFYVKTTVNLQRKCLVENIFIDLIWLNVQARSPMQTILYQFEHIDLWKWPKCPQHMQWTWWQTVTIQHKGLSVLAMIDCDMINECGVLIIFLGLNYFATTKLKYVKFLLPVGKEIFFFLIFILYGFMTIYNNGSYSTPKEDNVGQK